MQDIKVVFFDWYHTLSNDTFWGHLGESKPDLYKTLTKRVFVENADKIKDWMRGKFATEDMVRAASSSQEDLQFLLAELQKSCREMKFAYKNMPRILTKLKDRNIKLGIATDNMDVFSRYTTPSLNLDKYFDYVLCSSDIGHLKLDTINGEAVFFKGFFAAHPEYKYQDCLFIDDLTKVNEFYRGLNMVTQNISHTDQIESIVSKYFKL